MQIFLTILIADFNEKQLGNSVFDASLVSVNVQALSTKLWMFVLPCLCIYFEFQPRES